MHKCQSVRKFWCRKGNFQAKKRLSVEEHLLGPEFGPRIGKKGKD